MLLLRKLSFSRFLRAAATATAATLAAAAAPGSKTPKGRTESKIYISRGRNVSSEISYKKLAAATATAAALAAAAPPGSKTQWP